MSNTFINPIVCEVPVNCIDYLNGYILAVGGGGGKKFGVRNYLWSYKIKGHLILKNPSNTLEYPDNCLPLLIKSINKTDSFIVTLNYDINLYSLNISDGSFIEFQKINIIKCNNTSQYITSLSFENAHLNYTAFGDSTGYIYLYYNNVVQSKFSNNINTLKEIKYSKFERIHSDKVNDIQLINISKNKKYLITASVDCTIIISELDTLKYLHYLIFNPNLNINSNKLLIRSIEYDNNYLYSLMSPLKGASYISKWNINNGFIPLKTKKISDNVCLRMKISGINLIVGQVNGNITHIDKETLSNNYNKNFHIMAVNSIAIVNKDIVFSSGPDRMISSHKIKYKRLISISKAIFIIIISFFIYLFLRRIQRIK